jgi:hypothetical protein
VGGTEVGAEVGSEVGTEVAGPGSPVAGGGVVPAGSALGGAEVPVGSEPNWPPDPEPPDPAVLVRAPPRVGLGVGVAVGSITDRVAKVGAWPVPNRPIASSVLATAVRI